MLQFSCDANLSESHSERFRRPIATLPFKLTYRYEARRPTRLSTLRFKERQKRAGIVFMTCETKTALLVAYEQTSREYSEAVSALARAVGAALYREYELVQRKVAVAREASQHARTQLQEHVDWHKC